MLALRSILRPAATLGFVGLLLFAGCSSPGLMHLDANTAYAPTLRVQVTKPDRWVYISPAELRSAQRHISSDNARLNFLVYQGSFAPPVMAACLESSSIVPPSVVIYRESLGEERLALSEKVAGFEMWAYEHVLTGTQEVGRIHTVMINGKPFAHCRIRYPLGLKNGPRVTVERQFWVRSSPISALVISAACDVREVYTLKPEIDRMVQSLRLEAAPPPTS